jgi:hypothetical protein
VSKHATEVDVDACQTRQGGDVHGAGAEVVGEARSQRTDRWTAGHFRDRSRGLLLQPLTAMSLLRHLSQRRQYVCRQCVRTQHTLARGERPRQKWAHEEPDQASQLAEWEEQADKIRIGAHQSMLSLLEERGFVKDVAGYVSWLAAHCPY